MAGDLHVHAPPVVLPDFADMLSRAATSGAQTCLEEALLVFADCCQGRLPWNTSWKKRRAAGEHSSAGGAARWRCASGPRCG